MKSRVRGLQTLIRRDSSEAATIFLQQQLEAVTRGTDSFFGIRVDTALQFLQSLARFSILLFLVLTFATFERWQVVLNCREFRFGLLFKAALGGLPAT
jgi:hypothetical protein